MNVTMKQKETLSNYLKQHPELVTGRIDRKCESRLKLAKLWDEIAQGINSIVEGPQKSGKEWAKTWKDMKCYILKKEAKRRNYVQGTGGSPPKIAFSTFEEEVLELLTPEAAGIENIPEGGIYIEENPIVEDIIQENTETMEQDMQDNIIIEKDNRNERDSENIPPYNIEKRGKVNTSKINNTTQGLQKISHVRITRSKSKVKEEGSKT
ncbi:Regulatory protein zeste [Camponotus japonicus]